MSTDRTKEISAELVAWPEDLTDPNAGLVPYAGPLALHIARLEHRIEELEQKLRNQSSAIGVQAEAIIGLKDAPIPEGPSGKHALLSIQDIAELIRASK